MGKTFSTGLLTNGIWQDASNNVGIGAAPSGSYKFEVTGTAKVSSTLLVSGATTLNSTAVLTTTQTTGTALTLNVDASSGTPTGLRIVSGFSSIGSTAKLIQVANSAGDNLFSVNAVAKTSINTTSIKAYLTVKAANTIGTSIPSDDAGLFAGRIMTCNNNKGLYLDVYSGYSELSTYNFDSGGGNTMVLQGNGGNILFSTTTTPYNNAKFRSANGTNDYFSFGPFANSNIWTVWNDGGSGVYLTNGNSSWTGVSDERVKNIERNIENACDIIKDWRTVIFSWKYDTPDNLNVGLIAQDVIKTLPEAVDTNQDEDKTLGVRYTEVIPVLVKAIQELNERLNKAGL